MTQRTLHLIGIATTAFIHAAIVLPTTAFNDALGCSVGRETADKGIDLDKARVIEAALAIKAPEQKKKRQPQKKRNRPVKPDEVRGVSRDAEKEPEPKRDKEEKKPPKELIDPKAVFEKNRDIDLDEEITEGGEVIEEGSAFGSEWGTEVNAKGDPYIGELRGRIYEHWKLPTLETQTGAALVCVRLNEDGSIRDRRMEKSGIATIDRAVSEAMRKASGMDKPVPPAWKNDLMKKGICFRFGID